MEKSRTNATNVTMHPLKQVLWRDILKHPEWKACVFSFKFALYIIYFSHMSHYKQSLGLTCKSKTFGFSHHSDLEYVFSKTHSTKKIVTWPKVINIFVWQIFLGMDEHLMSLSKNVSVVHLLWEVIGKKYKFWNAPSQSHWREAHGCIWFELRLPIGYCILRSLPPVWQTYASSTTINFASHRAQL